MRDIGKNIRELRMKKNMTQDALAESLFVTRQTVSNYETGKSRPDIDMLVLIAQVLDTDVNTVLYGTPAPEERKAEMRKFWVGLAATVVLGLALAFLWEPAKEMMSRRYIAGPRIILEMYVFPMFYIALAWTAMCAVGMITKAKPICSRAAGYTRWGLCIILSIYFSLMLPELLNAIKTILAHQYVDSIRQYCAVRSYGSSFALRPDFLNKLFGEVFFFVYNKQVIFLLPGLLLWLCGFPGKNSRGKREKTYVLALLGLLLGIVLYLNADESFVLEVEDPSVLENVPYNIEVREYIDDAYIVQ